MLKITATASGEASVLRLEGRVSPANSAALREEILKLTDAEAPFIVLDMNGIERLDSSGIATLLEGLARAWCYGGDLRLSGVGPQVRAVIEVFRLQGLLLAGPGAARGGA